MNEFGNGERIEALVVCCAALSERARGRDSVDLALACLALGWHTELVLCGPARQWLHAQRAAPEGQDNFPRTLASLPLFELAGLHVIDDSGSAWPALGVLQPRVWRGPALAKLLARADRVFHP